MQKIKVIYVFGSGHSGSTLASLMLGRHSRIESVGEIKAYEHAIEEKALCNCGTPLLECSYWKGIHQRLGSDAATGFPALNAEDATEFARENTRFLNALLENAGKDFFCDSSKTKWRLFKYLASPEFEVTVLHVVRDGRAVAYSNFMKDRSYWSHLLRWRKRNVRELRRFFENGLSRDRYYRIRYEDLVADPESTLGQFQKELGLSFEADQLANWALGNHHVSGNPMAKKSNQEIRVDRRYLENLSRFAWFSGSLLIGPELKRYGYPRSRRRSGAMLKE